jgi:hypothetical protein
MSRIYVSGSCTAIHSPTPKAARAAAVAPPAEALEPNLDPHALPNPPPGKLDPPEAPPPDEPIETEVSDDDLQPYEPTAA